MNNCLRKVRREHEESQAALAQAVGVTRQTIIGIEKERHSPSSKLMLAIAEHYNIPVEGIFFGANVRSIEQAATLETA